ncbi:MAG: DUF1161 domain-containing protein [Geobacteraceae bacterium]|nr:DUF1161 domain-containing protein [Geobacteraceae bacterium]
MKKIIVVVTLSLVAVSAYAMKPCEELKSEIEAKLNAKGVKNFTLEIVSKEEIKDQKVVGSCEGGTKKITYQKGVASSTDIKPGK